MRRTIYHATNLRITDPQLADMWFRFSEECDKDMRERGISRNDRINWALKLYVEKFLKKRGRM